MKVLFIERKKLSLFLKEKTHEKINSINMSLRYPQILRMDYCCNLKCFNKSTKEVLVDIAITVKMGHLLL